MGTKEFKKLKEEKKDKIIRAAINEFHAKGYDNASTNVIVREAGISKGSLFKYFKSKDDLYYFVINYIMKYFMDEVKDMLKGASKDVFERATVMVRKSVEMCEKEPESYVLIARTFYSSNPVHKKVMRKWMPAYMKFITDVFAGADMKNMRYSRLKTSEILLNMIGGMEAYTLMEMSDKEDVKKFAKKYEKRVNSMLEVLKTGMIK